MRRSADRGSPAAGGPWPAGATACSKGPAGPYESLETNESGEGAGPRAIAWAAAAAAGSLGLHTEAALWQCGEQRLALRRQFNVKEIDVAKILRRYDPHGERPLEEAELRQLLEVYNEGKPMREDELRFIVCLSDGERSGKISQGKLLFALRAWFAVKYMPAPVAEVLVRFHRQFRGLPSRDSVRSLLLALNEFQPVSVEEAAFVRDTAVAFGASESRATLDQLRQAVAAWYLHIEREDTARLELIGRAVRSAHERVARVGCAPFYRLLTSGCEVQAAMRHDPVVIGAAGVAVFVLLVLMPLFEVLVYTASPETATCEHPRLRQLLRSTGLLGWSEACSLIFAFYSTTFKAGAYKVFAWTLSASLGMILLGVQILGATLVLSSTGQRCGFTLWSACNLAYVTVPGLALVALLCGGPCLYLSVAGRELAGDRGVDADLTVV